MPIIKHEYTGSIYPSAHEANKAAVLDMLQDVDFDDIDDDEALAQELIDEGFILPVFDTDVESVADIIGEIVEEHYDQ